MRISDAIRAVPDGVELSIFCQPKAAREGLVGLHGGALKVKVRAPALAGRANEALIGLLAETLGVLRGNVALASGAHSRLKRLRVSGLDRETAVAKLQAHLQETAGRRGRGA